MGHCTVLSGLGKLPCFQGAILIYINPISCECPVAGLITPSSPIINKYVTCHISPKTDRITESWPVESETHWNPKPVSRNGRDFTTRRRRQEENTTDQKSHRSSGANLFRLRIASLSRPTPITEHPVPPLSRCLSLQRKYVIALDALVRSCVRSSFCGWFVHAATERVTIRTHYSGRSDNWDPVVVVSLRKKNALPSHHRKLRWK
jgi:hypothetical protein